MGGYYVLSDTKYFCVRIRHGNVVRLVGDTEKGLLAVAVAAS